MENIEKQVIEWHREQFSWATIKDIENKFYEEHREFNTAQFETKSYLSDESIEELVDMCIVMMAGLSKTGKPNLSEHIRRKLEINKNRKWHKDGSRDGK